MISEESPHEGGTYPYPLLTGLDSSDSAIVEALVMALHEHYDDYKDADPGAIGWALDRQLFQWVGAISRRCCPGVQSTRCLE